MRLKITVWLSLVFALGVISSEAIASASDFKRRQTILVGSTVDDLAVSQDRFVISLNKTGKKLLFIDTWNWREMTGTFSLVNTVNSMAMNPETSRLYFAFSSGKIQWMDLSPLGSIVFNGSLSGALHLETGSTVFSGKTPVQMAVIQPEDNDTADCVFVETGSSASASLYWMIVQGNTVIANDVVTALPLFINKTKVELAASKNRLFAKFKNPDTTSSLFAFRCFLNQTPAVPTPPDVLTLINPDDNFQGVGVEQTGSELVIGDNTTRQLVLYGVTVSSGVLLDNFLVSATDSADQVWVKNFASEKDPLTFFALGALLSVLPLEGGTNFGAVGSTIDFGASPLVLADASTTDGYLYISPADSHTVNIVSPNPWIENITTIPGGTTIPSSIIETDTFTVKFNYDPSGRSARIADCSKFSVKASGCSSIQGGTTALGGSGSASIELSSEKVGEGTHTLGIFVQDNSSPVHQGRNALQVTINLPPTEQKYDLSFADQRIIFEFHSPDLPDLKEYKIYYGPSPVPPWSPSSPITKSAEPDKDYRIIVDGLTNGTLYCGQIVLRDTSGLESTSAIKCNTPQQTENPKDATGDKGGFGCGIMPDKKEAVVDDGLSQALVLIFPLIFLLIVKIKLRGEE